MADPERLRRLEELVRAHQARLRAYAYSRLGDPQAADDVVQEAFLDALDRLDHYDPSRPALPWLLGFVRNELREHLRELAARRSAAARLEALLLARRLERDETSRPADLLSERLELLRGCLKRLPSRSQDLVRLLYARRMTCGEVARRWGAAAGAVRVAIHRVRQALRECVERGTAEAPT